MTQKIDAMEELWKIKEELAAGFANVREFCEALMKYQESSHAKFAKAIQRGNIQ